MARRLCVAVVGVLLSLTAFSGRAAMQEATLPAPANYTFTDLGLPGMAVGLYAGHQPGLDPHLGGGGINNNGDIVGAYFSTIPIDDGHIHGFKWSNGTWAPLIVDPAFLNQEPLYSFCQSIPNRADACAIINVIPRAINDIGVITLNIGIALCGGEPCNATTGWLSSWGLVMPDGGVATTILQCPDNCGSAMPWGINNVGVITGDYNWDIDDSRGFRDSTVIDYPGAMLTMARGINDRFNMDVVGFYKDVYGGTSHGFLFSDGLYSTMDVPGAVATEPSAINLARDIVGRYSGPFEAAAFLMPAGDATAAHKISDGTNELSDAFGINDAGQIAGVLNGRFVLATPVPPCSVNHPPAARAGGAYTGDLGESLLLNGSTSNDPDSGCGDALTYVWSVDGYQLVTGATPSLSAAQIDALGIGTHTVSLTVTDTSGLANSAQTELVIYENRVFAVAFANPLTAAPGQTVTFNGASSHHGDPRHAITGFAWHFGDGTTSPEISPSHAFSRFGVYQVSLTVFDDQSKNDTAFVQVTVNQGNQPPVANAGGPYQAFLHTPVQLNGSGSTDPNTAAGDSIVSYEWTIDGGSLRLSGLNATLSAAQVDALASGSHNVLLVVTDSFGLSNAASATLTVPNRPPVVTMQSSFSVQLGNATNWNCVSFSDPGVNEGPWSAQVNYGDGTPSQAAAISTPGTCGGTGSVFLSHTYGQVGQFTVSVTVNDKDGGSGTATGTVTVTPGDTTPPATTATFASPNANGWHRFNVSVSLNASDPCCATPSSGVQSITYTMSGAQSGGGTFNTSNTSFFISNEGTTTVTYHATDNRGNVEAEKSIVVKLDKTQPAAANLGFITVSATSTAGAVVVFDLAASDGLSGIDTVTRTQGLDSGSMFPHGNTSESFTITDMAGNSTSRAFSVIVNKTLLSISVSPSTASVEVGKGRSFFATGHFTSGPSQPLFTASWQSLDPAIAVVNSTGSAAGVAPGQATIVATAVVNGNTVSCVTTITCAALTVTAPAVLTLTLVPGSVIFSFVQGTVSSDDEGEEPFTLPFNQPIDGAGNYRLTFAAPAGYTVTPTQVDLQLQAGDSVTVVLFFAAIDTTPPALTVSSNVIAEATGPAGANVTFSSPTATDASGVQSVSCNRSSGENFGIGVTTVQCSATDNAGNVANQGFTVTVSDTTPPVLTLPSNLVTDATSPAGAAVVFTVSAIDLVDGARPVVCTPASGAVFRIGLTTVSCETGDTRGNTRTNGFTVTVRSPAQIVTDLAALAASVAFKEGSRLLQNALTSIGIGDTATACGQLGAFINQTQAQIDKKLTATQASALIAAATRAKAALGCS